nr:MAG TPA: Protein of unknown function (DUF1617) [Caudoviricetes sp.]
MKITIYQLISTLEIEKDLSTQKLPIQVAYNLSKIFARAHDELKFYQEKFKEILKQYGEKNDKGELVFLENDSISIQKDKIDECQKEILDLQNLEIEMPDYTISLKSLDSIKISLNEISTLMPFICES